MNNVFSKYLDHEGVSLANLPTVFDAEKDAPLQFTELLLSSPQIGEVMRSLREYVPLMSNAGIGPHCGGDFYRLPNHYRSLSFLMPDEGDADNISGAIVFKGTEPLLPDLEDYYDWMLGAPFRASQLPLGLHFPLELKIPPVAMSINECNAEQRIATRVQNSFLEEYGRFGRLPVPLFVFKFTDAQVERYSQTVRARISSTAFNKVSGKIHEGLGIEVYFYPTVPLRVADLLVGNLAQAFGISQSADEVLARAEDWTRLFAELLQLGCMPYVPWNHGMGSCLDAGNVCVDGGFNDLLTLSRFAAIPSPKVMRRSLATSINILATTIAIYCSSATQGRGVLPEDSEARAMSQRFVTERILQHLSSLKEAGHHVDEYVLNALVQPSIADIMNVLHAEQGDRGRTMQYVYDRVAPSVEV